MIVRGDDRELEGHRLALLEELQDWLETPLVVLGYVWLGLLVLELTSGLTPLLELLGTAIWALFILDFALRLLLAPDRIGFLRANWLGALSLLLPALRIFRGLRLVRAARGLRLVKVLASLNRGMRSLRASMRRRGLGYVLATTLVVIAVGGAGMHALEDQPGGLDSYGAALWWTAMLLTSIGSEYWPRTPEGRLLCLALAIYGFAVFGYITASLASFFVDRDAAARGTN